MTMPNTIVADLAEELSKIRNDYENACRLVARMHFAATGSNDGPKIGVVEDVEAIAAEVESLRKQRDELAICEERYRWLCNKVGVFNDGYYSVFMPTGNSKIDENHKKETDAAIDAAIAYEKGGS